MKLWIKDPKTKEFSVSLTLLVSSFTLNVLAGALEMAGVVKTSAIIEEMFWGMVGLYFFRRMNIKTKFVDLDQLNSGSTENEQNPKKD